MTPIMGASCGGFYGLLNSCPKPADLRESILVGQTPSRSAAIEDREKGDVQITMTGINCVHRPKKPRSRSSSPDSIGHNFL